MKKSTIKVIISDLNLESDAKKIAKVFGEAMALNTGGKVAMASLLGRLKVRNVEQLLQLDKSEIISGVRNSKYKTQLLNFVDVIFDVYEVNRNIDNELVSPAKQFVEAVEKYSAQEQEQEDQETIAPKRAVQFMPLSYGFKLAPNGAILNADGTEVSKEEYEANISKKQLASLEWDEISQNDALNLIDEGSIIGEAVLSLSKFYKNKRTLVQIGSIREKSFEIFEIEEITQSQAGFTPFVSYRVRSIDLLDYSLSVEYNKYSTKTIQDVLFATINTIRWKMDIVDVIDNTNDFAGISIAKFILDGNIYKFSLSDDFVSVKREISTKLSDQILKGIGYGNFLLEDGRVYCYDGNIYESDEWEAIQVSKEWWFSKLTIATEEDVANVIKSYDAFNENVSEIAGSKEVIYKKNAQFFKIDDNGVLYEILLLQRASKNITSGEIISDKPMIWSNELVPYMEAKDPREYKKTVGRNYSYAHRVKFIDVIKEFMEQLLGEELKFGFDKNGNFTTEVSILTSSGGYNFYRISYQKNLEWVSYSFTKKSEFSSKEELDGMFIF